MDGMAVLRALAALLLLATFSAAQVQPPPACAGAVIDHERLDVHGRRVTFHLRFHTPGGIVVARSVVTVPHAGASDGSCSEGEAVDVMIDELVKERQRFLGP